MTNIRTIIVGAALVATSGAALAYKEGTTRDQTIAATQRKFKQMDADGRNGISPAELDAFMTRASAKRGDGPDPAKVARRLKRVDADANGSITLSELQAEEMEKFDRADANRNGRIDAGEAE